MSERTEPLSVVDEFEIKCESCNRSLVDVVITETNEQREDRGLTPIFSVIKVVGCPYCRKQSVKDSEYSGSGHIKSFNEEQYRLEMVDTNYKDRKVVSTIKLEKV